MRALASLHERAWLSVSIIVCIRRRTIKSSIALANQIVQVSTDAKARPTMTALTTMSAAMNMPHGDRSRGTRAIVGPGLVSSAPGNACGVCTAGGAGCTCVVGAAD